jgi:16S rRNA (guanine527-N7)-methyltransferase
MDRNLIVSILNEYGFNEEDKILKFEKYFNQLLLTNKNINLVSLKDESDILNVHLRDSLEFFKIVDFKNDDGIKLIDIGSGAGFPAVPIGIVMDKWRITLVESIRKKANFLINVASVINSSNIEVINDRSENIAKKADFSKSYEIVTARWVAKSDLLIPLLAPFVKPNGQIILWKNPEELENLSGFKIAKVHKYKIKGISRFLVSIVTNRK